jgi:hypothetical protein
VLLLPFEQDLACVHLPFACVQGPRDLVQCIYLVRRKIGGHCYDDTAFCMSETACSLAVDCSMLRPFLSDLVSELVSLLRQGPVDLGGCKLSHVCSAKVVVRGGSYMLGGQQSRKDCRASIGLTTYLGHSWRCSFPK